jgi:hypothetical protein
LVLLTLAVGLVVAIATNGLRLLPPAADLDDRWVWALRIGGAAVSIGGFAWLLALRERLRAVDGRGPDSVVVGLRTAATIMGLIALVAIFTQPSSGDDLDPDAASAAAGWTEFSANGGDSGPASRSRGGSSSIRGSAVEGGSPAPTGPVARLDDAALDRSLLQRVTRVLALILLVVAGAVIAYRALTRRLPQDEKPPSDGPLTAADATAGLEASLSQVRESRDPRQQITAAYNLLLNALAAAGAPRRPEEAPHEHLQRALGPLGIHIEPLHCLAGLYVLAQFSQRSITEGHRSAAADALEVSLRSLGVPHGPPGIYRPGPIDAEAKA